MIKKLNTQGFTLIELMLAMTIFSAVMVIATVGFIGMNRTFNRGLIRKELSESSQGVAEDVTRVIRNLGVNVSAQNCSSGDADCVPDWSSVCIGSTRYSWRAVSDEGGLFKDQITSCDGPITDKKNIMSDRYVVRDFKIEKIMRTVSSSTTPFSDSLFRISGVFTTADDSALSLGDPLAFDPSAVRCLGTSRVATVRTCAVERFNFVINARGKNE